MATDTLIEQLRVDYGREKERAMLLKMRVLTQELQVCRGIDVYHAARQAELSAKTNTARLAAEASASAAQRRPSRSATAAAAATLTSTTTTNDFKSNDFKRNDDAETRRR
eukprot:gene17517-20910_t